MIRRGRNRRSRNSDHGRTVRGPVRAADTACHGHVASAWQLPARRGPARPTLRWSRKPRRPAPCRGLVARRTEDVRLPHPTKETRWTHRSPQNPRRCPRPADGSVPQSRSPSRSVPARRRPPPRRADQHVDDAVGRTRGLERPRGVRRRPAVVGRLPGPRVHQGRGRRLATLDVKTAGADGVKAAITTLRTSLETLKASAGAELAPAVTGSPPLWTASRRPSRVRMGTCPPRPPRSPRPSSASPPPFRSSKPPPRACAAKPATPTTHPHDRSTPHDHAIPDPDPIRHRAGGRARRATSSRRSRAPTSRPRRRSASSTRSSRTWPATRSRCCARSPPVPPISPPRRERPPARWPTRQQTRPKRSVVASPPRAARSHRTCGGTPRRRPPRPR